MAFLKLLMGSTKLYTVLTVVLRNVKLEKNCYLRGSFVSLHDQANKHPNFSR